MFGRVEEHCLGALARERASRHAEQFLHGAAERRVQDAVDHEVGREVDRLHHVRDDLDRLVLIVLREVAVE